MRSTAPVVPPGTLSHLPNEKCSSLMEMLVLFPTEGEIN
jgi:hypothetical protein